jgi:hypothetical protein
MLRKAALRFWGGRAALFALLLQLAFSAGHVHPEDFAALWSGPADAVTAVSRAPDSIPDPPPLPGVEDDGCPICVSLQMLAVAVPVLPFQLPLRLLPTGSVPRQPAEQRPSTIAFGLFQSRAPPLV